MPKVPVYESQVEPRPLPGYRQESVATPALLGGAGDRLAQVSKGVLDAGIGLAAVAYNMQERENADMVFQGETKWKADYLEYQADVGKNRKGDFSKGVTTDTKKWWDESAKKHLEAMGNDVQRQVLLKRMASVRLNSMHSMSEFEAKETEHSMDMSAAASKVASIDLAAAAADEATVQVSIADIKKTNAFIAARKGITNPKTLAAQNDEDITKLHQQVIQTLAAKNPAAAKAYFDKHESEIRGSLRAEIGKFAETATAESVGDAVAAAVWSKFKPENSIDPVKSSDAEDVIRADSSVKNNPTALKAALAGFEHRVRALETQRRAESASAIARVEELVIKGVRGPTLTGSPAFTALLAKDPKAANHVRMAARNEEYADIVRAEAEERRTEAQLNRAGLDAMLELSDPDVLAKKTRDELLALRSDIGTQNTIALVKAHDALTKSAEALAAARIDNNTFKALAIAADLDPNEKGMSEAKKDRLVMLRAAVDARLALAARQAGKPLAPDERVKVAQAAFDDTVRVPGFFSAFTYGMGADLPASSLTQSERDKAVVVLPAGRVRVKDIPPLFVEQSEVALKKANRPVTQKAVAEMWLLNKDQWKP